MNPEAEGTSTSRSEAWPLPPHVQLRDFLPEDERRALLDWATRNEGEFRTAKVINDSGHSKSLVDPELRIGLTTRNLGPFGSTLEKRMRKALPSLEQAIGTTSNATSIELELAAHGDGAHYRPHLDVSYGEGRKIVGAKPDEDRVVSAVYYFYREPKAFSGGALRLYRFNARPITSAVGPNDYVDLEPLQNSLVAFPSWATHEVRRVSCASNSFADFRFALNCWFCRKL